MPSGKTHLRVEIGLLVACWLPLAVWFLIEGWAAPNDIAAFVFAYAFSSLFLSPDLDLRTSRPYLRWGVLRWLWAPYALVFRHRQRSHHVLLGPLSRIAYLGIIVVGGAFAYLAVARRVMPDLQLPMGILAAIGCGLYVPNLTHVLLDRMRPARSHRRRL
ncbi:DUF2227 family putative metal-binding protein [Candidatus Bipolaricaulota bacterium]